MSCCNNKCVYLDAIEFSRRMRYWEGGSVDILWQHGATNAPTTTPTNPLYIPATNWASYKEPFEILLGQHTDSRVREIAMEAGLDVDELRLGDCALIMYSLTFSEHPEVPGTAGAPALLRSHFVRPGSGEVVTPLWAVAYDSFFREGAPLDWPIRVTMSCKARHGRVCFWEATGSQRLLQIRRQLTGELLSEGLISDFDFASAGDAQSGGNGWHYGGGSGGIHWAIPVGARSALVCWAHNIAGLNYSSVNDPEFRDFLVLDRFISLVEAPTLPGESYWKVTKTAVVGVHSYYDLNSQWVPHPAHGGPPVEFGKLHFAGSIPSYDAGAAEQRWTYGSPGLISVDVESLAVALVEPDMEGYQSHYCAKVYGLSRTIHGREGGSSQTSLGDGDSGPSTRYVETPADVLFAAGPAEEPYSYVVDDRTLGGDDIEVAGDVYTNPCKAICGGEDDDPGEDCDTCECPDPPPEWYDVQVGEPDCAGRVGIIVTPKIDPERNCAVGPCGPIVPAHRFKYFIAEDMLCEDGPVATPPDALEGECGVEFFITAPPNDPTNLDHCVPSGPNEITCFPHASIRIVGKDACNCEVVGCADLPAYLCPIGFSAAACAGADPEPCHSNDPEHPNSYDQCYGLNDEVEFVCIGSSGTIGNYGYKVCSTCEGATVVVDEFSFWAEGAAIFENCDPAGGWEEFDDPENANCKCIIACAFHALGVVPIGGDCAPGPYARIGITLRAHLEIGGEIACSKEVTYVLYDGTT